MWDHADRAAGRSARRTIPAPRAAPFIAVDLGASPGGWSELLADQTTSAGRFHAVHAVDPGDLAVPLLDSSASSAQDDCRSAASGAGSSPAGSVLDRGVIHWRARAESAIAHMLCRAGAASSSAAPAEAAEASGTAGAAGCPVSLPALARSSSHVGNAFETVRHAIGERLRLSFS